MTKKQKELIIKRLSYIEEKNGVLEARDVVDDARDFNSPLHDCFEWDDSIAGEKYREEQARVLIKTVYIQKRVSEHKKAVPFYVRDPKCNSKKQGYTPIVKIKTKKEEALEVVDEEIKRIISLIERSISVSDYLGVSVTNDLKNLLNQVEIIKTKVSKMKKKSA